MNKNGAAEDGEKWQDLRSTREVELMLFASGVLVRWWEDLGISRERAIHGFALSGGVNGDASYEDGKAWEGR